MGGRVDYSLSDLLVDVPDDIFFTMEGNPDYNAIFIEVAKLIKGEKTRDFTIHTSEFLSGSLPNLTSFQRSVAKERERRRG
jgi:hypothetical protein